MKKILALVVIDLIVKVFVEILWKLFGAWQRKRPRRTAPLARESGKSEPTGRGKTSPPTLNSIIPNSIGNQYCNSRKVPFYRTKSARQTLAGCYMMDIERAAVLLTRRPRDHNRKPVSPQKSKLKRFSRFVGPRAAISFVWPTLRKQRWVYRKLSSKIATQILSYASPPFREFQLAPVWSSLFIIAKMTVIYQQGLSALRFCWRWLQLDI